VEAHTYRFCGHMPGDTQPYRTCAEVAAWRERDPVTLLAAAGVPAAEVEQSARQADDLVATAEQAALSAPAPNPAAVGLGAEAYQVSSR